MKYYDKYCKNSCENVQCMLLNKKKNSQITKENIGIMMLSNIPNISTHIASQLLEPFKNNIYLFLDKINQDRDYLKDIKIKSKDKERKLKIYIYYLWIKSI